MLFATFNRTLRSLMHQIVELHSRAILGSRRGRGASWRGGHFGLFLLLVISVRHV